MTDKGAATFIVMRRLNGKLVRHVICRLGEQESLADVRTKARQAITALTQGTDPKEKAEAARRAEEEKLEEQRREQERRTKGTFAAVAEDFISKHVKALSTADEVEAAFRREFVGRWGANPVGDVTRRDVMDYLAEIKSAGSAHRSYRLFSYLRKFYAWAIAEECYGLIASPCDRMNIKQKIGERKPRQRTLADSEIRLVWAGSEVIGAPFGHLAKFLLLTAQRRDEAADMTWPEVDLDQALWTIPAERMKADAAHLVPLAPEAVSLLRDIKKIQNAERLAKLEALAEQAKERKGAGSPDHKAALAAVAAERRRPSPKGDYVFTTTDGLKPVVGFSKAKARLDQKIIEIEQKRIVKEGGRPEEAQIAAWRLHDLRRTARTRFSAIPSQDIVRELAISHTQSGLHKVYDLYSYIDERRALFEAWARRLMAIVSPDNSGKIVDLNARRA